MDDQAVVAVTGRLGGAKGGKQGKERQRRRNGCEVTFQHEISLPNFLSLTH